MIDYVFKQLDERGLNVFEIVLQVFQCSPPRFSDVLFCVSDGSGWDTEVVSMCCGEAKFDVGDKTMFGYASHLSRPSFCRMVWMSKFL